MDDLQRSSSLSNTIAVSNTMERFVNCKICQQIWRVFTAETVRMHVDLGSAEEVTSTNCPDHTPLVKAFIDFLGSQADYWTMKGDPATLNDLGISCFQRPLAFRQARLVLLEARISMTWGPFTQWELLLENRSAVSDHPGQGCISNPDWADIDNLIRWKHECLSTHGARCENPLKIWHIRPAWLIDVERRCLVQGSSVEGSFVALSYTYGRYKAFHIDTNMLMELQEPESLFTSKMSGLLAPIIRHAIPLTAILGERYLWADSVCITHENRDVTNEQLNQMGAIYANAIITIVATDGDSQDGLPGLRGISPPRRSRQGIFPFSDERIIVRDMNGRSGQAPADDTKPYHTRGWTYQEEKMSTRKIFFRNQQLNWECHCCASCEDSVPYAKVDQMSGEPLDPFYDDLHLVAAVPELTRLGRLISDYNSRQLSYEEDALPAFSGVLSVLSRTFTGGFLYGLPEMFFDGALCWRCAETFTYDYGARDYIDCTIRRRAFSEEPKEGNFSAAELPSWSWIGWQGDIMIDEVEAILIERHVTKVRETTPITEWFTGNSPNTPLKDRRRIRSTWYEDRTRNKDLGRSSPLPPGWTRHDAPANTVGESHSYPDGCGTHVFKHVSEPSSSYFYPFPIADVNETTPPFVPSQTSYLFCETRRGFLRSVKDLNNGHHPTSVLLNDLGKQVGTLFLQSEEDKAYFSGKIEDMGSCRPDSPELQGLKSVELVAVCKSRVYSQTNHKIGAWVPLYGPPQMAEDVYAVLWIEWRDGVAYRRGSGEVNGDEWESLDLEPVSLVLG